MTTEIQVKDTSLDVDLKWEASGARIYRGERLLFDGHNGADFPAEREALAAQVAREHNLFTRLEAAARCALADLEGIMPQFEPSGDRQHPGWITIRELEAVLNLKG